MRFGASISGPDPGFPDGMRELEHAGLESLWFGLDDVRWDPVVLAAAAAMATKDARLVVALADPTPVIAKSIASLDALSEGRVEVLIDDAESASLLRAMLGGEQVSYEGPRFRVIDAPVLPAPIQERIPLWTRKLELVPVVDGWLATDVTTLPDASRCAVLVDGERSDLGEFAEAATAAGFEEIVLRLRRPAWSAAGKVLAGFK